MTSLFAKPSWRQDSTLSDSGSGSKSKTSFDVQTDSNTSTLESLLKKKKEKKKGVIITSIRGKQNVVHLGTTADKILRHFSQGSKEKDNEREKLRIVTTAAHLSLSDVKLMDTNMEEYPSSSNIADLEANLQQLSHYLPSFLATIFCCKRGRKLKSASICQAIMQATRPNTIVTPLLLELEVKLHHLLRYSVDHLYKFGFSYSYIARSNVFSKMQLYLQEHSATLQIWK
jgi:hypothetical protein